MTSDPNHPIPHGLWEPHSKSFIKVRRNMLGDTSPLHPMFRGEKACAGYAWLDLVARAEYANDKELLRGQQAASQSYLAARWNWNVATVANFLKELESDAEMITRLPQKGRRSTLIYIRDYDFYNKDQRDRR